MLHSLMTDNWSWYMCTCRFTVLVFSVVKSKGVSVVDATAMWYLSVLASTAQAVLPMAPQLREAIILHTR